MKKKRNTVIGMEKRSNSRKNGMVGISEYDYELNFNKVFGRLSLSWILKEEDDT